MYTMSEKYHSKMYQTFSAHTMPEKFENTAIIGNFGFVFEENSAQGNHLIIMISSFSINSIFFKSSGLKGIFCVCPQLVYLG